MIGRKSEDVDTNKGLWVKIYEAHSGHSRNSHRYMMAPLHMTMGHFANEGKQLALMSYRVCKRCYNMEIIILFFTFTEIALIWYDIFTPSFD